MPLTPEEFSRLATKADLNDLETKLKAELASKKDADNILTAVDGLAKKFDDHDKEHVANQTAHDRFEKRLKELKAKPLTTSCLSFLNQLRNKFPYHLSPKTGREYYDKL